jgi:dTDP-4-amino-4,6-dideoxygalactose transaminase
MIPRHRPPFGPAALACTGVRSLFNSGDVEQLERKYKQQLGVKHAVWLPSARYGITRTIQSHITSDAEVICSAFNCGAVHHAAAECQRTVRYADCSSGSLLMDCSGAGTGGHALILSEMFGHRFSPKELDHRLVRNASLRIFDMAMAIPAPADMQRMQQVDVTVLSFGLGKSLYAGWGGMALTQCDDLSAMLQRCRDQDLASGPRLEFYRWNADLVLRTVAHEPFFYRQLRSRQQRRKSESTDCSSSFTADSHEWHRPPTSLHVARSLRNLEQSVSYVEKRRILADEYRKQLCGCSDRVQLLPSDLSALSHFCVRVSGDRRAAVRQHLWNHGIDVGTLFPFPHEICRTEEFPQAARTALEILNLPLSTQLDRRAVIGICDALRAGVESSCTASIATQPGAAA